CGRHDVGTYDADRGCPQGRPVCPRLHVPQREPQAGGQLQRRPQAGVPPVLRARSGRPVHRFHRHGAGGPGRVSAPSRREEMTLGRAAVQRPPLMLAVAGTLLARPLQSPPMHFDRGALQQLRALPARRSWLLWLLVLMVLLKAAVPLLAATTARERGVSLADVCSVYGVRTAALEQGSDTSN